MPPDLYDHRQSARALPLLLGASGAALLALLALPAVPGPARVGLGAGGAALLLSAWLFASLRIQVASDHVRAAFGPGWPRRSWSTAGIVSAEPVRNRWWYGWGVRLTPTGWMWNVHGLSAVLVTWADGRRLRLGTDEPHALAQALRAAAQILPVR